MNCKPRDLAITVGMHFPENNGRIVLVVRGYVDREILPGQRCAYGGSELAWVCESQGQKLRTDRDGLQQKRAIADVCLRPIRDPGDDAVDESHRYLPPVPQSDKVTA